MSDIKNKDIKPNVKAFFGEFKARLTDSPLRIMIKLAALLVSVAVLFAIGVFSVSVAMKKSVSEQIADNTDGKYDCILILGAKVNGDTPSHMLSDRLEKGIALYLCGAADKILMSGDSEKPDEYDEVSAMKAAAVARGIPEEDIICDTYGLSTYDSILRAKEVYGMEKIAVVTQDYHLYRAVYIADKLELEVLGISAGANEKYSGALGREAREIFARFKDMIYTLAEKEPKYMTESRN